MSGSDRIEDGGPAFAVPGIAGSLLGMSLRDWFAGQALVGMANHYISDPDSTARGSAEAAYFLADQMLAERKECRP